MAHFRRLRFLAGDKAGHLHDDPHQHHRTGLRGFTGQVMMPAKIPSRRWPVITSSTSAI
jgi:hypothetical protein